jgi:3-hydroxyacyl-CoA dehydrogenase
MGRACGALFTTVVPKVSLLARSRDSVDRALQGAIRSYGWAMREARLETGDYERNFVTAVSRADWIVEAVAEKVDLKREILARVDSVRRPDAIVVTLTSSLSINSLAEDRSESFRKHFLGLHFFNPPQLMLAAELAAGRDTEPEVVAFVDQFARRKLGRVVVRTADSPGFIGNRIGFKVLNDAVRLADVHSPLLIDRMLGRYTGRRLPALATVDHVGWDVYRAIVANLHRGIHDEAQGTLKLPWYMDALIGDGVLGNKSGGGFFKIVDGERHVLDLKSGMYQRAGSAEYPELQFIEKVEQLHGAGRHRAALKSFAKARGEWADLARRVIAGYVSYSFHRVGEVAGAIDDIDAVMSLGFNWVPPGVLAATLGVESTATMMQAAGLAVPSMLLAADGTLPLSHRKHVGRSFESLL